MSVYVDDMYAPFGRMLMCHMIADSPQELLDIASKIGLAHRWIQHPGTYREHFDVSKAYRAKAVKLGAVEVSQREMADKIRQRKPIAETETP